MLQCTLSAASSPRLRRALVWGIVGLLNGSRRRCGPLSLCSSSGCGGAVLPGDLLKTHRARLLRHFLTKLNNWENRWVNLDTDLTAPLSCKFFLFFFPPFSHLHLAHQEEIKAWNETEWGFHLMPCVCDRLDLLWLFEREWLWNRQFLQFG